MNRVSRPRRVANRPFSFVAPSIAKKYDFDVPPYEEMDQVVEVGSNGQKL